MFELATIEAELAAQEARVPHLREGCEKQIIWHDKPAKQTDLCVIYLHGFSASGQEMRPLPDLVAQGLGANLFLTRLTGHGQDGEAMGKARLADWQADVAEALEIGHTLGREVIVMGCSTGCTLMTLALAEGAKARAVVYLSPNFGLRNWVGQTLLDFPGSRQWAKYIVGTHHRFKPRNADHAAYWTLSYPNEAVHVMGDALRAVRKADLSKITTPALFCYNERDKVVHPERMRDVMGKWGDTTVVILLQQTDADDPMGHIMAGEIQSPDQTAPLAARILAWCQALPKQ
ncbi:alpha/beta hydrolase [Yoonia sp.]|uniref:alpha/beta hydrolase n=1 Tax=Yoonia sp. TaxID=2212373 RepID=UPI0023B37468